MLSTIFILCHHCAHSVIAYCAANHDIMARQIAAVASRSLWIRRETSHSLST